MQNIYPITHNGHTFALAKYKECAAREGIAYSCDLLIDGKRAAYIMEAGQGGEVDWHWLGDRLPREAAGFVAVSPQGRLADKYADTEAHKLFLAWVRDLPPYTSEWSTKPTPHNCDTALEEIIGAMLQDRAIRRSVKRTLCFRLKGDEDGSFRKFGYKPSRVLKASDVAELRALVVKQHGDKVEVVLNDAHPL